MPFYRFDESSIFFFCIFSIVLRMIDYQCFVEIASVLAMRSVSVSETRQWKGRFVV